MTRYVAKPIPANLEPRLRGYLSDELRRIGDAAAVASNVTLTTRAAEPERLEDGQLVYADGSNWDPGDGEGVYARVNGAWQSLVGVQPDEAETITGNWTFTGTVTLTAATIVGLSSDDLSDVSSIEMVDENETVTGAWTFTQELHLESNAASLTFNVDTTSDDPDIRWEVAGTLTALLRWDSSENKLNFQDRQSGAENVFILDLDEGIAHLASHTSVGKYLKIGQDNSGTAGAVGNTQHTDSASLNYRTYLGYDCYWDDVNDQWTAIRPTLGRKSALTLSYHDPGLKYKYYDSASASWSDASFSTYVHIDPVNGNHNFYYNDFRIYDGASALAYHFDHAADVMRYRIGRRARFYEGTDVYYTDVYTAGNTKSPNSLSYLADSSQGGEVTVQAVSIADDGTATFEIGTYAMVFIISSYNSTAFAHIGFTSTQTPVNYGSGSLVSTGASNPNIDGRVNIWPSASGEFSIKNRLGSTRSFYILTFQV